MNMVKPHTTEEERHAYKTAKVKCPVCNLEVSRNALLRHKRRIHHVNIKYAL